MEKSGYAAFAAAVQTATIKTHGENNMADIIGYRELTEEEKNLMNDIKGRAMEIGSLVEKLRRLKELDQRWVSIGATDLQTGFMALVRSVARPTTF